MGSLASGKGYNDKEARRCGYRRLEPLTRDELLALLSPLPVPRAAYG